MKHGLKFPDFSGLTVKDKEYKQTYLRCLSVVQDGVDAKTLKGYALKYAKERHFEPRAAFAALDDWRYTTIGKVAFLDSIGFPLADSTHEWVTRKMTELSADGVEAIKNRKNVEISPIVEKSEKTLTPEEMAAKIIALVEEDKLTKDQDAPIKLLSLENATPPIIEKVAASVEARWNDYATALQHGKVSKQFKALGVTYSTAVRRRNDFSRVVQRIKTFHGALTKG